MIKILKSDLPSYKTEQLTVRTAYGEIVKEQTTIFQNNQAIFTKDDSNYTLEDYFKEHNMEIDQAEERNTNILLLAMVYNVDFPVSYTMTAPYTHEYCVQAHQSPYIESAYCEPVTARNWFNQLPTELYSYLLRKHPDFNYEDLLRRIKDVAESGDIKDVNGNTYRGQPTSDEYLQMVKKALQESNTPNVPSQMITSDQINQFFTMRDELFANVN